MNNENDFRNFRSSNGVMQERTGWRDLGLSERHRLWGYDAPIVDIDFLVIEYDHSIPKALIEYKNEHSQTQFDNSNANYRAIANLGQMANVPSFYVRYCSKFTWFRVEPMNDCAAKLWESRWNLTGKSVTTNERSFVNFIYSLRERRTPDNPRSRHPVLSCITPLEDLKLRKSFSLFIRIAC